MRWNTYDDEGAPELPYGMETVDQLVTAALDEIASDGISERNVRELYDANVSFLLYEMKPDEAERIIAVARTIEEHCDQIPEVAMAVAITFERG